MCFHFISDDLAIFFYIFAGIGNKYIIIKHY
ncbi:MAG: hypothetical protein EGQ94_05070 [Ruminococcus sp.]|nr:hypothetical protein [Ruminococcus sp.]